MTARRKNSAIWGPCWAAPSLFSRDLPAGTLADTAEGIRATVIGASEYTIQVSGATSYFTSTDPLPLLGFKVIHVLFAAGGSFAEALVAALRNFDIAVYEYGYVIALGVQGEMDYAVLREIAGGLHDVARGNPGCPLIVAIEQDIARSVGSILKDELALPNELICIDSIMVGDLDFIDIGKPVGMMDVFPVTVKSLLFSSEPML